MVRTRTSRGQPADTLPLDLPLAIHNTGEGEAVEHAHLQAKQPTPKLHTTFTVPAIGSPQQPRTYESPHKKRRVAAIGCKSSVPLHPASCEP